MVNNSATMWSHIALLFVLLWGFGSSVSVDDCPEGLGRNNYLTVYEDKCYYFYTYLRREFDEAQSICRENGGNLASVKSKSVDDFLWSNIKGKYNVQNDVWIGLSDSDDEGLYLWRDGSKMDYENFESGTGPDTSFWDLTNKYQDCVVMAWDNEGLWKDIKCEGNIFSNNNEHFVCEYAPKPTTTTTIPTTTKGPTTRNPTTNRHTIRRNPTTHRHSTRNPTTNRHTIRRNPTTNGHTTRNPTTHRHTTRNPTTNGHTTINPTTNGPTTRNPTTRIATTSRSSSEKNTKATAVETEEVVNSRVENVFPKNAITTASGPSCPPLVCDLNCDLDGFDTDKDTGCMICKCQED